MEGFQRVARVRKVTFADGSTETLVRFIEAPLLPLPGGASFKRVPDLEGAAGRAESCRRVALARARRELRWAVRSIGGDHLLTCTFRKNLEVVAQARAVWSYFVKLVRARSPGWCYVAVMERQDRGAIHFHAAVKGWQNVAMLRACWLRAAGDFGGNIDVQGEKRRWGGGGSKVWALRRLSGYMGKYLGKAFEWMPKHSQRFTASEDRPRPEVLRWWIEYCIDVDVIRSVYWATCGDRAHGCSQWLSPDGGAYMVSSQEPARFPAIPF